MVVAATPDGCRARAPANSALPQSPAGLTSGSLRSGQGFEPIARSLVASVNYVWLVNNDVSTETAPELINLIKANPGKYNYASGNTGGIAYGGYIKNAR